MIDYEERHRRIVSFISDIADDCIENLSEEDKRYLIEHPDAGSYHRSYGLSIRNKYIYSYPGNLRETLSLYRVDADNMSSEILTMIISKLLPEFEFESNFCRRLYGNPRFLELRKSYKERYGHYPVALVEKYNCQMHFEPQMLSFEMFGMLGFNHSNEEEWDVWRKECKVSERNNTLAKAARDSFIEELEEILAGHPIETNLFLVHGNGGAEQDAKSGSQEYDTDE